MNKNQSGCFLNIKCGYCGSILTVDTQEQILCHNCFQKYDEERHAISINEDFVAIIVEASNEIVSEDTSNEQYSTDHRDEMLINIVQTKPALWNFQIPLRERTKAKKKALWKEVENMLGGLLTMDDAMKRWKYLRDCYVRYKRQINTYVPSGSAAQPSKKQKVFRFYEVMQFIDDPLESARTVSNLSDCDEAANSVQEQDELSLSSTSTTNSTCESRSLPSTSTEKSIYESKQLSRAARRSHSSTPNITSNASSESFMSELRDNLKNVLNTPVLQKDAVDYFVACLSDGMRKLSDKKYRSLQIAILQLLAEAEKEEAKENSV
ncbi:uncharacterized protein LOC116850941 [Odontomachus brunneus]|uniref:uncharacterized protein LOC116850941 n=1 Tax=Odontomachus brunneus TaxID=486640 RepID=UPI0013F2173A|nr:uncharacterized protein LOC116850941 [Odontomachus brunneus]